MNRFIKTAEDPTRVEDYSNVDSSGSGSGPGGYTSNYPASRTDQSGIDQERSDGDTSSSGASDNELIEFENDAQTPGLVDSPLLDDTLDYRRQTGPLASRKRIAMTERQAVLELQRLCWTGSSDGDDNFEMGDSRSGFKRKAYTEEYDDPEFAVGDKVFITEDGDTDEGVVTKVMEQDHKPGTYEYGVRFNDTSISDNVFGEYQLKRVGSKRVTAAKDSLSLLNIKKKKSQVLFDLDNITRIDRSKGDSLYGDDRKVTHIVNQVGQVSLASLNRNDRIVVAGDVMQVESIERNGVMASNVCTGFQTLIEGKEFTRLAIAEPLKLKPDYTVKSKRSLAWFETKANVGDQGLFADNDRDLALGVVAAEGPDWNTRDQDGGEDFDVSTTENLPYEFIVWLKTQGINQSEWEKMDSEDGDELIVKYNQSIGIEASRSGKKKVAVSDSYTLDSGKKVDAFDYAMNQGAADIKEYLDNIGNDYDLTPDDKAGLKKVYKEYIKSDVGDY